jgi:hypothetical protein
MDLALRALLVFCLSVLMSGSFFFACSSGDSFFVDSNRAPVAKDSALVTVVDRPVSGFMQATDDDGDQLTYRIVSGPLFGVVQITDSSTGAFTFASNVEGVDQFNFQANDGQADSNVATVTITVNRDTVVFQRATTELGIQGLNPDLASPRPGAMEYSVQDPFDPYHLISLSPAGRIVISTDGGVTWSPAHTGLPTPAPGAEALVSFATQLQGLVYMVLKPGPHGPGGVFRSTDGGVNWRHIAQGVPGRVLALAPGPLNSDGSLALYARIEGEHTLYKAIDHPY